VFTSVYLSLAKFVACGKICPVNRKQQTLRWWALLLALLLIAVALRTYALERTPPGLTHDEASNGHDGAGILRGELYIYFPVGYGHEPLYNYSVALMTALLGQSIFTLRLTTVFWSCLLYALTVALARRWWGRRAALFAAAALTVSFWTLMLARVGLRAPTLPVFLAASFLAYDHAQHATNPARRRRAYLLAGLWLGLSFYTYMASRGFPAAYLAYLLALALLGQRETLQRVWAGTGLTLISAALVGAPLFIHLQGNPELEYRLTQLEGPLVALRTGDVVPLLQNILASLPMLGWRGDPLWLYNIGGRPALEPLLALAFWGGALVALLRLRQPRYPLLLLWLGAGLAPAFITGPEATALRAIAALPAIYLLIALGLETLWQSLATTALRRRLLAGALALAFVATGSEAARAYFISWGQDRDVRVLYHHHVVALGRALDATADSSPAVITTIYPGEFHDPYTMETTLQRRDDLRLYWCDGRGALFFPLTTSRLYTQTLAAVDPVLDALVAPQATALPTLTFDPADLTPAIYGYRWESQRAWDALRPNLARTVYVAPHDPPPAAEHAAQTLPLTFGESVALVGYRVTRERQTLDVLTVWEVTAPVASELVLFTHLLTPEGEVVVQADRLDAPNWQWQPGDRFVQLHRLALPPDTPPGLYYPQVGYYSRAGLQRLALDRAPGPSTRVLLAPVEIPAP